MSNIIVAKKNIQDKLNLLSKKLRDRDYASKIEKYFTKLNYIENGVKKAKNPLELLELTDDLPKIEKDIINFLSSTDENSAPQIQPDEETIFVEDESAILAEKNKLTKAMMDHENEKKKIRAERDGKIKQMMDATLKKIQDSGIRINNVTTFTEFDMLKSRPDVIHKISLGVVALWDEVMINSLIGAHYLRFLSFDQMKSINVLYKSNLYVYLIIDKIYGEKYEANGVIYDKFTIDEFQTMFDDSSKRLWLCDLIKDSVDEKNVKPDMLTILNNFDYIYGIISDSDVTKNTFASDAKCIMPDAKSIEGSELLKRIKPHHLKFFDIAGSIKKFDKTVFDIFFTYNPQVLKEIKKREIIHSSKEFIRHYFDESNINNINFEELSRMSHEELLKGVVYPILGDDLSGDLEKLKVVYYGAVRLIPEKNLRVFKNLYETVYKMVMSGTPTAEILFGRILKNEIPVQKINAENLGILIDGYDRGVIDLGNLDVEKWKLFDYSSASTLLKNKKIKKMMIDGNLLDFLNDIDFSLQNLMVKTPAFPNGSPSEKVKHDNNVHIFMYETYFNSVDLRDIELKYGMNANKVFPYNRDAPFSKLGHKNIDNFDQFLTKLMDDNKIADQKELIDHIVNRNTKEKQITACVVINSFNLLTDNINDPKYKPFWRFIYVDRLRYLIKDGQINKFTEIVSHVLKMRPEDSCNIAIKISHISSSLLKITADTLFLQFLADNIKKPGGIDTFQNIKYALELCTPNFLASIINEKATINRIKVSVNNFKALAVKPDTIEVKCDPVQNIAMIVPDNIRADRAIIPIANNIRIDYNRAAGQYMFAYSDLLPCDEKCDDLKKDFFGILSNLGIKGVAGLASTIELANNTKNIDINNSFIKLKFSKVKTNKMNKIARELRSLNSKTNITTDVLSKSVGGFLTIPIEVEVEDNAGFKSLYTLKTHRFCGAAKCVYYYKNNANNEYILLGLFSKNTAIAEGMDPRSASFAFGFKKIKQYDAIYEAAITAEIIKKNLTNFVLTSNISEFKSDEIGYDVGYISHMESAFLDLQEFVKKISILPNNVMQKSIILKIAVIIIDMLIKLYNEGLMYVDLKMQNIMVFANAANNEFVIKFIDVGSIIPSNLYLGEFYNHIFIQNSKANCSWVFGQSDLPDWHNSNMSPEDGDIFKDLLFRINVQKTVDVTNFANLNPNDKELFLGFQCSFLMNIMYFTLNFLNYYINGENYEGNYNYRVGEPDTGLTSGGAKKIQKVIIKKDPTAKGELNSKKPNSAEFELSLQKFYFFQQNNKKNILNDRDLREFATKYFSFLEAPNKDSNGKYYDTIIKKFGEFTTELHTIYRSCKNDAMVILNPPIIINKWMLKINKLMTSNDPTVFKEPSIDFIIGFDTENNFKLNVDYFRNTLSKIAKIKIQEGRDFKVETIDEKLFKSVENAHFLNFPHYGAFLRNFDSISITSRIKDVLTYNILENFTDANSKRGNLKCKLYDTNTFHDYAILKKISYQIKEIFPHPDTWGFNNRFIIYNKNGEYFRHIENKYGIAPNSINDIGSLYLAINNSMSAKNDILSKNINYRRNFDEYFKLYDGTDQAIILRNIQMANGLNTKNIVFIVDIEKIDNIAVDIKVAYGAYDIYDKCTIINSGCNIIFMIFGNRAKVDAYFANKGVSSDQRNDYINNLIEFPLVDPAQTFKGGNALYGKQSLVDISDIITAGAGSLLTLSGLNNSILSICILIAIILLLIMLLHSICSAEHEKNQGRSKKFLKEKIKILI